MASNPKKYDLPTRIEELERRVRALERRGPGGTGPGGISMWAGVNPPTGFLICDGSAVSREEYPLLFSIIGTRFGAGDGSTTFNVPDMRGRFALGSDSERKEGRTGGSMQIAVSQMPSHAHNGSNLTTGSGGEPHSHDFTIKTLNTTTTGGSATRVTQVASKPSGSDGKLVTTNTQTTGIPHSHGVFGTTGAAGSGADYLPPYLVINYIVKT